MAKRESINLPGMAHGAPIPMGSKIGKTVYSSGIAGRDQEKNVMPEDPAEQARCMFNNIRQFMEIAGGTPENIIHMRILLKSADDRKYIDPEWQKMFPDEDSRPARHALTTDVRQGFFQCEVVAVLD